MLPVLLHRVSNAAQLLAGLDALLAVDPSALERRPDDLASAGGTVDEVGWLLALLGSASGADLLLERRAEAGLAPLVACVRACLRREGKDLDEAASPLPLLAPSVASGWQVPWCVGSLLYLAGRSLPDRGRLAWTLSLGGSSWRLACSKPEDEDFAGLRAWLASELPGARVFAEGDRATLELPQGWLREPRLSR